MGLFYVAAAYTYGEPMQARTNNVSVVVYYENGSSNLTAEGLLPPFVLKLAAMARHICWALWCRHVLATLVSLLSLVWQ